MTHTQAICETWLQPFDRYSIWNMPIGSNAHYIPANIGKAGWVGVDKELFYQLNSNDPQRPVYAPYSWTERSRSGGQYQGLNLPISDYLIVEDCKPNETPNNASAFLLPDGHTIVQLNPLARPTVGGDMYGWRAPDQDITEMGIYGGHGGSGLSSIGGSIRKGELIGDTPIQHALKVNIWSNKYLAYNHDETPGYRWPADRADNYAADTYRGINPELEMGALLAIPSDLTAESLGLETTAGKKLFDTLKNYGAYVVDDSAWDAHYWACEQGVEEEFAKNYGYNMSRSSGLCYKDYCSQIIAFSCKLS
ncbi:MAG: hypothetical protein ACRC11_07100, partial [Xenococcaceae cyanobacterium]